MTNLFVLAGAAGLALTGCSAMNDAIGATGLAGDSERAACSEVTAANYNAIEVGMTIEQVSFLLNCPADEGITTTNATQRLYTSHFYKGLGDRFIGVVLVDGTVSRKSKGGL
ncbi:MAG: hypothetical protein WA954_05650 [Parerythrobacter sp.]